MDEHSCPLEFSSCRFGHMLIPYCLTLPFLPLFHTLTHTHKHSEPNKDIIMQQPKPINSSCSSHMICFTALQHWWVISGFRFYAHMEVLYVHHFHLCLLKWYLSLNGFVIHYKGIKYVSMCFIIWKIWIKTHIKTFIHSKYRHSVNGFSNRCLIATLTKGKVVFDFPALCQYCSKRHFKRWHKSKWVCVQTGWGASFANEVAMQLQRNAPWDILLGECFLNNSRATRKWNLGGGVAGLKIEQRHSFKFDESHGCF